MKTCRTCKHYRSWGVCDYYDIVIVWGYKPTDCKDYEPNYEEIEKRERIFGSVGGEEVKGDREEICPYCHTRFVGTAIMFEGAEDGEWCNGILVSYKSKCPSCGRYV